VADRVGLYLHDSTSIQESIKIVQKAEREGLYAIWQAEPRLSRSAIVMLSSFASTTNRIKLGTAVINIWTRNVATLSASFLSLDELAPDRIMLGLGAWYDPLASQVGVSRNKPLLAMREFVDTTRALLNMERVSFSGEHVRLYDLQLDERTIAPIPRHVPLYIGATGPRMMAVAGEIADGVILTHLVSPHYTQGAIEQLLVGANKAGRALDTIDRPQVIVCSIDNDKPDVAIDRARKLVTLFLRQQPGMMRVSGVRQELIDEIAQVLPINPHESQINDAMHLVPDDVVHLVTATGTVKQAREKVREYIAAGATYPVLYPLGNVNYIIDQFANGYSRDDDPVREFFN